MTSVSRTQTNTTKCLRADFKGVRVAIVYRPIGELKLNPKNPRLHNEKQIEQIAHSIEVFGPIVPILTDGNGQILAGHGRLLAGLRLGLKEFPTISVEHLTDEQAKAFAIADNRLTHNSAWDKPLLVEQLKFLSQVELDFSLEVTGFEVGEIDVMLDGITPAFEGEADPADEMPEVKKRTPISKSGDLWLLGPHRVYCGDALNVSSYAALTEGRQAAMVFTDPPLNVTMSGRAPGLGAIQHNNCQTASGETTVSEFTDFLAKAFHLQNIHSRGGALHYIFTGWQHMQEVLVAGKQAYTELTSLCVWVKDTGDMGSLYRSTHELVFVFKNGTDRHLNNVQPCPFGTHRTNVWNYPVVNSFSRSTEGGNLLELHPTVKPVALFADAVLDCSARGEIVLDPFLGSGTTVIAAERTGRVCYGIEIDPLHVDTAVRRWHGLTGHTALHANSGRTFNELQEESDQ